MSLHNQVTWRWIYYLLKCKFRFHIKFSWHTQVCVCVLFIRHCAGWPKSRCKDPWALTAVNQRPKQVDWQTGNPSVNSQRSRLFLVSTGGFSRLPPLLQCICGDDTSDCFGRGFWECWRWDITAEACRYSLKLKICYIPPINKCLPTVNETECPNSTLPHWPCQV